MDESPRAARAGSYATNWLPMAAIIVVTGVAGLVLPQWLPSATPPPAKSSSSTGAAVKDSKQDWTYVPPTWPEPPNHTEALTRLGLGTVAVLALCAGTLWGCKRWLRNSTAATPPGMQLQRLETLTLGNRCVVHLIHVGQRPVLVGADAGGIKTIVPLPESFSQTMLASEAADALSLAETGAAK